MPVELVVPPLGESIVEATVGRWLKKEGDPVRAGDLLVELETDKVNQEIAAERTGVLERILHGEGDTVRIGDVLGVLADAATLPLAGDRAPTPEAAPPKPAGQGDGAGETRTSRAGRETGPTAPASEAGGGRSGDGAKAEPRPPVPESPSPTRAPAAPSARRLAAEEGVDLTQVHGSGRGGRVTGDDVRAFVREREEAPAPPSNREERVRMTRRRQTIARRLVEAQQTAAILTTFNEVDLSAVITIRKRRRDAFKERHGVGLGFMSFFVRAAVGALKAFPILNSEVQGDEIVYKKFYDIGIAVAAEGGLVVPVVRDAERKSFAQIEKEIADLATRARDGGLTPQDLMGGTFTITNGGVFGSMLSTPILNPPQVGILGMHAITERPVAVNGQVEVRPIMYLALSYDHRVVDGREAVQFLVRLKELIEDPEALLLEG
jgi:2-oxoglutarate dehydrogenase E2 component (dihydrolipoamide succinyltransferase)